MEEVNSLRQSFAEYLDYCQFVRRMSDQTIRAKLWILNDFADFTGADNLNVLTTQQVNDWIANQARRGLNSRTINTRICHIVAMLRYFRDMGVTMPELKIRLITKQKETEPVRRVFYTREQIAQVLEYCNQVQWLLVKLSFDCGLRITELRNIRLENISDRMIVFTGKGGKRREVHMSEEARKRLDRWIISRRIQDYLWERSIGEVLSVEEIRHLMRQPFHLAGYRNFHPHSLRHSFATDIQRNGATLMESQKMLGHSTAVITERYLHGLDGQMATCFERLKFSASEPTSVH